METRTPLKHLIFHCQSCSRNCMFEYSTLPPTNWIVTCYQCRTNWKISVRPADEYGRIVYESGSNGVTKFTEDNDKSVALTSSSTGDYYEILGVSKDATSDQIKRNYYKLAMKHHPDKYNGDNPKENEEKFKIISEAYQILSDETLRERYDRYGKDDPLQPDGGFADPEKFFKQMFGGDLFVDIIGELSISRDFGDAISTMQQGKENQSQAAQHTPEEREQKRKERINKLAKNLIFKMSFHCDNAAITSHSSSQLEKDQATKQFEDRILEEVNDLKNASYGVELLNSIGYMYTLKSRQWFGKEETLFGIGKFWNDIREKGHVISETVGTIRSAVELQAALSKLEADQNAHQNPPTEESQQNPSAKKPEKPMTPEEKSFWEQRAAQKGIDTLWKGSKMEIEGVIRDVCDLLLSGQAIEGVSPAVTKDVVKRRANALRIIGRIYESARASENSQ